MTTFVVISDAYWDDPFWASRHYIPESLSQGHRVIFVEKATTWISPLRYHVPWSKLFNVGLKSVRENMFVYTPFPRFPFDRRFRSVSVFNQALLAIELNNLLKRMEISHAHIISFDHKASIIFKKLKVFGRRCYYVVDEISEFNWPMASKKTVLADELETIKLADVVIATSKPLVEKCLRYNRNVGLISHGVAIQNFDQCTYVPEDILRLQKPIIGFVGKIEQWVNIDLIAQLADMLPEVSLVLIGPINIDVSLLRKKTNIHLLGPRERDMIPSYLKMFDCGIIPFKQTQLTYSVNPLKMYEYLAAGLPVIGTPMQAIESREYLDVFIETSPIDFADRIRKVLAEDSPDRRKIRIDFAYSNSWEKKAKQLVNLMENVRT